MLRIVNHNKGIIIQCPFVCGTTFLHSYVLQNEDYEHVRGNWHIPDNYKVIRIIRDPIQRFYAYYNKFIHANDSWYYSEKNRFDIKRIENKSQIEEWFKHFSLIMHYDMHLGLQKLTHIKDHKFNIKNIQYMHTNHLQKFLNVEQENYTPKTYSIPFKKICDKYLYELYKIDLEWLDTIRIIK